ncbi:MAG: SRPBCC family protein [Gemmatimonadales bacterium]
MNAQHYTATERGGKMTSPDYTTSFTVDQSPEEAFAAITNVRGWWSGEIEGDTDRLGAEFTYRVPEVHYCKLKITEFVPGKAVMWHVLNSDLSYTNARHEWDDTRITFQISPKNGKTEICFTHVGLVPQDECYESCSDAWGMLVNGNLRNLITTGRQQPNLFGSEV